MLWIILRWLGVSLCILKVVEEPASTLFPTYYSAISYFHRRIDTSALFYSVQGVGRHLGSAVWVDIMSYTEPSKLLRRGVCMIALHVDYISRDVLITNIYFLYYL